MRTKLLILMALFLVIAAVPAFAQGTAGGSGVSAGELKAAGLVIGMAIASGLCGLGQGKAVAAAAEAVARNPGARGGQGRVTSSAAASLPLALCAAKARCAETRSAIERPICTLGFCSGASRRNCCTARCC